MVNSYYAPAAVYVRQETSAGQTDKAFCIFFLFLSFLILIEDVYTSSINVSRIGKYVKQNDSPTNTHQKTTKKRMGTQIISNLDWIVWRLSCICIQFSTWQRHINNNNSFG